MRARAVVVGTGARRSAAQVACAENAEVVEALAADRADHPLYEGILPRGAWSGKDLVDPHALDAPHELVAVDTVTITEQVGRSRVIREGLDDLVSRPKGSGVVGDVEVDEFTAVVAEDDEDEEQAKGEGGDHEEVDRDDSRRCAARRTRHEGEGRGNARCMYLATVSSATS